MDKKIFGIGINQEEYKEDTLYVYAEPLYKYKTVYVMSLRTNNPTKGVWYHLELERYETYFCSTHRKETIFDFVKRKILKWN